MGLDIVAWIIPEVWCCKLSILVLKLFFLMSNRSNYRIWGWTFCLGLERSLPCFFCPALTVTCCVMGSMLFPLLSLALCSVCPVRADEHLSLPYRAQPRTLC